MAGMDSPEPSQPKKTGVGLRRPKRRVGVRIDMTPMVDIAFLLLIFFMVTTVFRQPQAMEVNLPPKDAKVEVAQSNVMTVYVDDANRIFYRMADLPLQRLQFKDLQQTFKDETRNNPELIILVKLHRKAKYKDMVDIMDELEFSGMERFSLIPMTEEDVLEVGAQP